MGVAFFLPLGPPVALLLTGMSQDEPLRIEPYVKRISSEPTVKKIIKNPGIVVRVRFLTHLTASRLEPLCVCVCMCVWKPEWY